ncbi:MAG: hypothetical protein AB7F78_01260 [Hyphomicrobiaceae bacterium]
MALFIALGCIGSGHVASAEPPGSRPVLHGRDLSSQLVGPAAAGLGARSEHPSVDIRDGKAYPFLRRIETNGRYDGLDVRGPHLLAEGVAFTGPLDIETRLPLVLRGVSVRTHTTAHWAIHTRPGSAPVFILWSSVGAASTAGAPQDRSHALARGLYLRSDRVTVYRSHIHHAADGIQIHARGARIVETLIDGLTFWQGDHNDGVQMLGQGGDVEIVRSRIVNANAQTSCLNLVADRVRVEASYLAGGGWTVYAGGHQKGFLPGSARDVVFRDNIFGRDSFPKSGSFGAITGWDRNGTGIVWQRNRWSDGALLEVAR